MKKTARPTKKLLIGHPWGHPGGHPRPGPRRPIAQPLAQRAAEGVPVCRTCASVRRFAYASPTDWPARSFIVDFCLRLYTGWSPSWTQEFAAMAASAGVVGSREERFAGARAVL